MAKWQAPVIVGTLLLQFALVGCKQDSPAVATLPPPSFDAPRLAMTKPVVPVAPPQQHQTASVLPVPSKGPVQSRPNAIAGMPREWVPPVAPRPWKWIVIHHSATTTGGAAAFDKMHRAKGWDELGYDFVIGNGTDTPDGQVEVGPRWTKQKYGAHAKTPDNRFNEYGIGICLVGNFDVERPTPRQLQSLTKLASFLMRSYHITPDRVLGHRDTKATDCPGRYMDVRLVRRQAGQLAGTGSVDSTSEAVAPGEMLNDLKQ